MTEQEQEVALVPYSDELDVDLFAPRGRVVSTPDLDAALRPTQPVGRKDDRKILLGLKLAQTPNLPIDGAIPGKWVYLGTKDMYEHPRVVLLDYLKDGQVWWPDYDPNIARPTPYCWSDNGRQPGEVSERRPMLDEQSGPCFVPGNPEADCARNVWVNGTAADGSTKRIKPDCTRQRRFLVALVAPDKTWYPAVWECHGAAMKFAKEMLTAKLDTRACKAVFILSAKHMQEPGRDYYVPQMVEFVELNEAGRRKALALRDDVLAQIEAGDLHVETVDDAFDPYAETGADPNPEVEEDAIPF